MEPTDTVRSVLGYKGYGVRAVAAGCLVVDALRCMADEDIGALAVMEGGRLLGVFTERDYARKIVLLGRASAETTVTDAMTHPATIVPIDTSVDDCMRDMVAHRSRHVFITDRGVVVGIVSAGDLLNWTVRSQAWTISQLHGYITGGYLS